MARTYSPSVFIGLGNQGIGVAEAIVGAVKAGSSVAGSITAFATMDSQGHWSGGRADDAPIQSAVVGEHTPEAIQANSNAIAAVSGELSVLFRRQLSFVRAQDQLLVLHDAGFDLAGIVQLVIVAAAGDPVGSAAIIPVLRILHQLLDGPLIGYPVEISIALFTPDVFGEDRDNPVAFARTYACCQELEAVAANPLLLGSGQRPAFNCTYVFAGKLESGAEISSVDALARAVGSVFDLIFRQAIGSDASYSVALANRFQGQATHYASFGRVGLAYPVREIRAAITGDCLARFVGIRFDSPDDMLTGPVVAAEVKQFIVRTKLDALEAACRQNSGGGAIWKDLLFDGLSPATDPTLFIEDVRRAADEHGRTVATEAARALASRRASLATEVRAAFQGEVERLLDERRAGPLRAQAFADAFLGNPNLEIPDDGVGERYTINDVELAAKRFFDSAVGVDRAAAAQIDRDIEDKQRRLERLTDDLASSAAASGDGPPSSGVPAGLSVEQQIAKVNQDIASLSRLQEEAWRAIRDLDTRLADPVERRTLLRQLRSDEPLRREEAEKALHESEKAMRNEMLRLEELVEERRRTATRFAVRVAASVFGSVLLVALVGRALGWSSFTLVGQSFRLALGTLITGGVIAGWRFWTGVHARVGAARIAVVRRRDEKVARMHDLAECEAQSLRTSFEHDLHGGLIGLVDNLKMFASEIAGRLSAFRRDIGALGQSHREDLPSLEFPNNVFWRFAVSGKWVRMQVAANEAARVEFERFCSITELSPLFARYTSDGNTTAFEASLADFVDEVFEPILSRSVDDVLRERAEQSPDESMDRLSQLLDASKAAVLLDAEQGGDVSQSLVYVGVAKPADSFVAQELRRTTPKEIIYFDADDRAEIVVARLKVGFPAFQIAAIRYGRAVSRELPAPLSIDPAWPRPELLPSLYLAGDVDSEERRIIALGRAFGLVTADNDWFIFQGETLGGDLGAATVMLRQPEARLLRQALVAAIERYEREETALDRLEQFMASSRDEIDREIVDRAIIRLNPLR